MMRTRLLLPALLPLLALPALAQPANGPTNPAAPSKGEAQALQLFNMLDADGDGRISLDEAKVAFRLRPSLRDLFDATDTNHDGYLTQQEIRAAADRKRAERAEQRQREGAETATTATRPATAARPMSAR